MKIIIIIILLIILFYNKKFEKFTTINDSNNKINNDSNNKINNDSNNNSNNDSNNIITNDSNNDIIVKNNNNDILFISKTENEIDWDIIYNKHGYNDYYIIYPDGKVKTFYYMLYSKYILYNNSKYNLYDSSNYKNNKMLKK